MENLENIIESLMFVAGEAIELEMIQEKFELKKGDIDNALEKLNKKYNDNSGIQIVRFKNKIQFSTNPIYAEVIETVLNPIKEKILSRATLETMAIIAYKQPITKLEIEEIRGVGSDYAIDLLSKNSLIEVIGRKDAIGKPLLYGTTDDFLKRFELLDLEALPKYEEIVSKLKTINTNAVTDNELFHAEDLSHEKEELFDTNLEVLPDFLKDEQDLQKIENK